MPPTRSRPVLAPILMAVGLLLGATACGDGDDGGGASSPGGGSGEDRLRVAIAVPSSVNDQSFSQSAYSGFTAAMETGDFEDGGTAQSLEVDDAVEALVNLSSQADVVIAVGGQYTQAAVEAAERVPDTEFVVINGDETGPNLSSWWLSDGEIAYLGGVMVAEMVAPDTVAKIYGLEIAPLQLASRGFELGVHSVDPDIEFISTLTDGLDNAADALEATNAAFEAGADVIRTGMGGAISGMEESARQNGGLLLSDVIDKCDDAQVAGLYFGSASTDVGFAVETVITGMASGDLEPGFQAYSIEYDEGFILTPCEGEVPAETQASIDAARERLLSGEVSIG